MASPVWTPPGVVGNIGGLNRVEPLPVGRLELWNPRPGINYFNPLFNISGVNHSQVE